MHNLITIQAFSEKDLLQAAVIHRLSFFDAWSKESLQSTLEIPHTFGWSAINTVESKLVGFLIIRQLQDEAEIMTLAIHHDWRRLKIASKLLASMDASLKEKNVQRLFLEVQSDNLAALTLYEGLGFKKIGERPNYYPIPNGKSKTAYVLAKQY